MSADRKQVRVAAAQLSGGIFDPDRAVEQLLGAMASAAADGVELLVLPECYIGGYPYWRGHVSVKQETELGARLCESSIRTDGPEVTAIAQASASTGVAVVVGCNERDPQPGAATCYNSVMAVSPDAGLVGCRRKLVPTHTERAYWGRGTARDVRTFALPFGNVGALVCYEHHMLAARLAMTLLGEEIHCALWPGYWQTRSHIADKQPGPAADAVEIDAVVRNYAMSSQNFVVSANAILPESDVPEELRDILGYNLARGGSSIVGPSGRYLATPRVDEECLVTATLDFWDRALTKSYLDSVGHYGRWDIFDLRVDGRSLTDPAPADASTVRDDHRAHPGPQSPAAHVGASPATSAGCAVRPSDDDG